MGSRAASSVVQVHDIDQNQLPDRRELSAAQPPSLSHLASWLHPAILIPCSLLMLSATIYIVHKLEQNKLPGFLLVCLGGEEQKEAVEMRPIEPNGETAPIQGEAAVQPTPSPEHEAAHSPLGGGESLEDLPGRGLGAESHEEALQHIVRGTSGGEKPEVVGRDREKGAGVRDVGQAGPDAGDFERDVQEEEEESDEEDEQAAGEVALPVASGAFKLAAALSEGAGHELAGHDAAAQRRTMVHEPVEVESSLSHSVPFRHDQGGKWGGEARGLGEVGGREHADRPASRRRIAVDVDEGDPDFRIEGDGDGGDGGGELAAVSLDDLEPLTELEETKDGSEDGGGLPDKPKKKKTKKREGGQK